MSTAATKPLSFSAREPAERAVIVALSPAEVAAVILFHHRQRQRIAKLAGELSVDALTDYTPDQIGRALEECQDQRAAHEARSFELTAILRTKQPLTVEAAHN